MKSNLAYYESWPIQNPKLLSAEHHLESSNGLRLKGSGGNYLLLLFFIPLVDRDCSGYVD